MGVDIWAMSKARFVNCPGDEENCSDDHCSVVAHRKSLDGREEGCYVVGKGGREFSFRVGSYHDFDAWRKLLSIFALGVMPEEVWNHPGRYRKQSFFEIVDFPDSVGFAMGPKTAGKLYADFAAHSAKARKFYRDPETPKEIASYLKGGRRPAKNLRNAGLFAEAKVAKTIDATVLEQTTEELEWMWHVYRDFRRAFKLASDGGLVTFC